MKENVLNNKYVKVFGLTAGISSIFYSIYRKTTPLKGVGNYFLFTLTGTLVGASIYLMTKE